jgi:pyrroline-5-carboxylate reductase
MWSRPIPAARRTGLLPSTPVEVRQGVVLIARSEPQPLDADVAELFGELGLLVPIDEGLVDVAMGLMSTAPAFLALVAEAQVDAGVRHGMPAERARSSSSRPWPGRRRSCATAATTPWPSAAR